MNSSTSETAGCIPTDQWILKSLWLLFGATMSLSAVAFFRFDVANAHLDAPMFVVLLIAGWALTMTLLRGWRLKLETPVHSLWRVVLSAVGLFLWHVLALLWSPETSIALRECIKVAAGCLVMILAVGLMPRRDIPQRFWTAAVWGGALLCGFMMYRSFYEWHLQMLATELDTQTNDGRNHFAGTLSYLIPFAAAYGWTSGRRVYRYIPFAVTGVALLSSGSRSGSIATLLAILTVALSRARVVGWWRASRPLVLAVSLLALAVTAFVYSSGFDIAPVTRRWVYLYDPQAVPELHSYENRMLRIRMAIEYAAEHPIAGLGIGQLQALTDYIPHNDYVLVLTDLGLVGEVLLLSVLGVVGVRLFRRRRLQPDPRWVLHASRGAFVAVAVFMLTMDRVYSTLGFWVVMAMLLVASDQAPGSVAAAERPGEESTRPR